MLFRDFRFYSPPEVDRLWGIWRSCYSIPKAIFYLIKGLICHKMRIKFRLEIRWCRWPK